MKKLNQQGMVHIWLVVGLVILVAAGGLLAWRITQQDKETDTTAQTETQDTEEVDEEPAEQEDAEPDPYEGWKKHTVKNFGVSFYTPKSWSVDDYSGLGVCADGYFLEVEVKDKQLTAQASKSTNSPIVFAAIALQKDNARKDCGGVLPYDRVGVQKAAELTGPWLKGQFLAIDQLQEDAGTELFVVSEYHGSYNDSGDNLSAQEADADQFASMDDNYVNVELVLDKEKGAQYHELATYTLGDIQSTQLYKDMVKVLNSMTEL